MPEHPGDSVETAAAGAGLWDTLVLEAERESPLWGSSLRPPPLRELDAVFSPLGEPRFALGIETIYEGYLLHYGRPRLFAPESRERALLLGDYLYAHGLVRIAQEGDVAPVSDLAELISLCAQLRADDTDGDGWAWAATIALLGTGKLGPARAALRERGDAGVLAELARRSASPSALESAVGAHAARVR
jgi:hypothetical protein